MKLNCYCNFTEMELQLSSNWSFNDSSQSQFFETLILSRIHNDLMITFAWRWRDVEFLNLSKLPLSKDRNWGLLKRLYLWSKSRLLFYNSEINKAVTRLKSNSKLIYILLEYRRSCGSRWNKWHWLWIRSSSRAWYSWMPERIDALWQGRLKTKL